MNRKLIKQGGGGLTFYVPKKWTDLHHLKAGDEIEVESEESKLIIFPANIAQQPKSTVLEIDSDNFNVQRSTLGGLYRAGYDEIKIKFKDPRIIPLLQKAVDSLSGFEIFDIKDTSCTISLVYQTEPKEIHQHVLKMVYIIKTMQNIIQEDLLKRKYLSIEALFQFRNDVLKQRDLVMRTIVQQRLLDDQHFPFYTIVLGLWNIARNYYLLYENLEAGKRYSPKNLDFMDQTFQYFDGSFAKLSGLSVKKHYLDYKQLRDKGLSLMKNNKEASIIASFCLNILMAIQSMDSSLLVLDQLSTMKDSTKIN